MRIFIVVVLAIIAIGAAGVWALGEYGHVFSSDQAEARAPLVHEPELVAANDVAQPPAQPNAAPALRSAPAPQKETAAPVEPQSAPAPADAAAAAAPAPAAAPFAAERLDAAPAARSAAPPPPPPPPPPAAADPVVTPQSTSAAPVAAAAVSPSLAAQFKSRKVTYNRPPAKLALNKAIDVSLVINATDDADAGKDALQGFPGTVVERDVDLSDTVSAQLTGVGFDITSQTVERQKLSGKTINRWQWRVTPTETGTRTLILEIFGYESGSLDAEPLDAYRDDITVEVGKPLDQVINWAKSVQPVFAVLAALAGAMSALFAFLRFREEKKKGKAAS